MAIEHNGYNSTSSSGSSLITDCQILLTSMLHTFNNIISFPKLLSEIAYWMIFVLTQLWLWPCIFVHYALKYAGSRAGTGTELALTVPMRYKWFPAQGRSLEHLLHACEFVYSSHQWHNTASFKDHCLLT